MGVRRGLRTRRSGCVLGRGFGSLGLGSGDGLLGGVFSGRGGSSGCVFLLYRRRRSGEAESSHGELWLRSGSGGYSRGYSAGNVGHEVGEDVAAVQRDNGLAESSLICRCRGELPLLGLGVGEAKGRGVSDLGRGPELGTALVPIPNISWNVFSL